MKILRYNRCKSLPAPFWLYVLELVEIRGNKEDPKLVAQLYETKESWATKYREAYKHQIKTLKKEIKEYGETAHILGAVLSGENNRIEEKIEENNVARTAKKFNCYKYQISQIEGIPEEDLSDVDLFWDLHQDRHF